MSNRLGSLIIDVEGFSLTPQERERLAHPWVGGVIYSPTLRVFAVVNLRRSRRRKGSAF